MAVIAHGTAIMTLLLPSSPNTNTIADTDTVAITPNTVTAADTVTASSSAVTGISTQNPSLSNTATNWCPSYIIEEKTLMTYPIAIA
jgi:hypothetical protein